MLRAQNVRSLAKSCDQFISSCLSTKLREKRLREKDINIEKCIEFSRASELSKAQADEMKQINNLQISPSDEDVVHHTSKNYNNIHIVRTNINRIHRQIHRQHQERNVSDVVIRSYRITINSVKPLVENATIVVKKITYRHVVEINKNQNRNRIIITLIVEMQTKWTKMIIIQKNHSLSQVN